MLRGLMIVRWLAPAGDEPQGSQSPSGQGKDEPKYVTEEQLNRAITARLSDLQKKFDKTVEAAIGGLGVKLDQLTEGLKTTPSGGTDTKDTPKGVDLESHPFVKGLQKQLEEQKRSTEKILAERDAEKASARDQKLRSKLSENLTKGGLDPRHVGKAVGLLIDVEKRVRFSDDDGDEVVFKDATGDLDLDTGLKGWLKGDDAKIFLPPRGSQGSGDRGQGRPPAQGQQAPSLGAALLNMVRPSGGLAQE